MKYYEVHIKMIDINTGRRHTVRQILREHNGKMQYREEGRWRRYISAPMISRTMKEISESDAMLELL